jgi:hypothetical protein
MADKIPNLEVKDYSDDKYELKRIEGTIKLDAWSGFKSRQGEYNSKNDEIQSDGTTSLSIGGDMVLHNPQVSQEHLNAYNYLIQHQETIKTRILSALLGQYQELQQQYGYMVSAL